MPYPSQEYCTFFTCFHSKPATISIKQMGMSSVVLKQIFPSINSSHGLYDVS